MNFKTFCAANLVTLPPVMGGGRNIRSPTCGPTFRVSGLVCRSWFPVSVWDFGVSVLGVWLLRFGLWVSSSLLKGLKKRFGTGAHLAVELPLIYRDVYTEPSTLQP